MGQNKVDIPIYGGYDRKAGAGSTSQSLTPAQKKLLDMMPDEIKNFTGTRALLVEYNKYVFGGWGHCVVNKITPIDENSPSEIHFRKGKVSAGADYDYNYSAALFPYDSQIEILKNYSRIENVPWGSENLDLGAIREMGQQTSTGDTMMGLMAQVMSATKPVAVNDGMFVNVTLDKIVTFIADEPETT